MEEHRGPVDRALQGREERSKGEADAYPPLILLKAWLLRKCFRIPSGPELENQITDRRSFKKFLRLALDKPTPDHSTFSRFRSRVSNEGIAVDARLVQSASRPIGEKALAKEKKGRVSVEVKLESVTAG